MKMNKIPLLFMLMMLCFINVNSQIFTTDYCLFAEKNSTTSTTHVCNWASEFCCNHVVYNTSECCNANAGDSCNDIDGCFNPFSATPSNTPTKSSTPSVTPSLYPTTTASMSKTYSPTPSQTSLEIDDILIINQNLSIDGQFTFNRTVIITGSLFLTNNSNITINDGKKITVKGNITINGQIFLDVENSPSGDEIIMFEAKNINYDNEYTLAINEKYEKDQCQELMTNRNEGTETLSVILTLDDSGCSNKKKNDPKFEIILPVVIATVCCGCVFFVVIITVSLFIIKKKGLFWKLFTHEQPEDAQLRRELKRQRNSNDRNFSVSISSRHSSDDSPPNSNASSSDSRHF